MRLTIKGRLQLSAAYNWVNTVFKKWLFLLFYDTTWLFQMLSHSESLYIHCSVKFLLEYFQLQNRGTETSHLITFTQGEVTLAGAQALYMHESYELSVARCCMVMFSDLFIITLFSHLSKRGVVPTLHAYDWNVARIFQDSSSVICINTVSLFPYVKTTL